MAAENRGNSALAGYFYRTKCILAAEGSAASPLSSRRCTCRFPIPSGNTNPAPVWQHWPERTRRENVRLLCELIGEPPPLIESPNHSEVRWVSEPDVGQAPPADPKEN
jgi:hypothetical protein